MELTVGSCGHRALSQEAWQAVAYLAGPQFPCLLGEGAGKGGVEGSSCLE